MLDLVHHKIVSLLFPATDPATHVECLHSLIFQLIISDPTAILDVIVVSPPSKKRKKTVKDDQSRISDIYLYGFLVRVVSCSGVVVNVVPAEGGEGFVDADDVKQLRLEALTASELDSLCEYVDPLVMWRGSMAFYEEESGETHSMRG